MAVGTKIGDLFFDVSADVAKAAVAIPKAGATLGASLTKSIGSAISRSVSAITTPIVTGLETAAAAGAAVFGAVLTQGFTRLRAIDDAQGKLRALGHTTEEVAGIMDSALQAVLGTQYNLGEAATIAASAVAAGIKPGQELTNYLSLIADTATVAGISLESAGAIINKTTAFQRVYLREINQLAQRGIPIFTWLQREYGVTGEKLREMVSAGEVDAATFQRVIQENIGGAAVEFGLTTFSGALRNTFAAMGRLGETLLGPFFDSLRDFALPAAIEVFDELNAIAKPWMESFAQSEGFTNFVDTLSQLPAKVGPFIDTLKEFAPLIAPLAGFFGAAGIGQLKKFLGPLGAILPKIHPLVAAFVGLAAVSPELRSGIGDVVEAIGNLFASVDGGETASGLTTLIELIGTGLGGALSFAAEQIEKLKGPLDAIGPFIREVISAFSGGGDAMAGLNKNGAFGSNLKKDLEGVSEVATTIGETLRRVVDAVVDAWPTIQSIVQMVLGKVRTAVEFTVTQVLPRLVKAFQIAVDWVVDHWPEIRDTALTVFAAIVSAGQAVVDWVRTNWPQIKQTVTDVVGAIQSAIQWFADNILPHLIEGFRTVAAFVEEVWPQIQSTIADAMELIRETIEIVSGVIVYLWDTFGQTILMAVQTVWDFVSGHIEAALDVVQGIINTVLGIITGDWGRAWDGIKQFLSGIWGEIETLIQLALDSVKVIINLALDNLKVAWDLAWGAIKKIVSLAIDLVVGYIQDIPGRLAAFVDTVFDGFSSAASTAAGAALDAITNVITDIIDAITAVPGKIVALVSAFTSAGASLGVAIIDGFKSAVKATAGFIGDIASAILSAFKSAWNAAAQAINNFIPNDIQISPGSVAGVNIPSVSVPLPDNPIPTFSMAGGGIIPGMWGTPQPGVAHGGEMVLNRSQQGALFDLLSSGRGLGDVPPINVNIDARGATDPAAVGRAAHDGTLMALAQYTRARGN